MRDQKSRFPSPKRTRKNKANQKESGLLFAILCLSENQLLSPDSISTLDSESRFSQDTKYQQFLLKVTSWPVDPPPLKSTVSGDEESKWNTITYH